MKRLSIGSKRENAKQVDINLKPKHLWLGGVVFVMAILFHMFVYSPYLETKHYVVCQGETEKTEILDNMTQVCGVDVPLGMSVEETQQYIDRVNKASEVTVYVR